MPTGLTGAIYEGKDVHVADFIFKCAKYFGGLMHLREAEATLDTVIPLREVDTNYYDHKIAEAKNELHIYRNLTLAEAAVQMDLDYRRAVAWYNDRLADRAKTEARYAAVLTKVEAWGPPTEEHQDLKNFAMEQLKMSMSNDCCEIPHPAQETPEEWLEAHIRGAKHSVTYWEEKKETEVKRAAETNKWVSELVDSLRELKEVK